VPQHDQKRAELLARAKRLSQEITERVRGLVDPDRADIGGPADDGDTSEMIPLDKTVEQPPLAGGQK
jgi:hypothetical protein